MSQKPWHLIDFLVRIQKEILSLKKCIKDNLHEKQKMQKEHLLFLVDILENLDRLNKTIAHEKHHFDEKSLLLFKSFDVIRKKIKKYLDGQKVCKIELGLHPEMDFCEIVETEEVDDIKLNGTIKSVLSDGHMHAGKLLKPARVTTYITKDSLDKSKIESFRESVQNQ